MSTTSCAMTKYNLNLPLFYTLNLSFGKRRRKPGESTLLEDLKNLSKVRAGNKLSRAVRIIFEKVNIKAILGGNIAFMFLTTSLLDPTSSSLSEISAQAQVENRILSPVETQLLTQVVIRYPVDVPKLNQGYSFFHPGLDIDGETGDSVFPIQNGMVELREFSKFGYGNSVIIDHKNGFKSRYAHLSKIKVKDGEEVNTKTQIGDLGSTGHSTGPHLHLEVYKQNQTINPQTVLGPISR